MNVSLPLFIAGRISGDNDGKKKISPPAVRVATISIASGVAVIILAVAIVVGFKKEVGNKVIGFGSHIQITNFDSNSSYETHPVCIDNALNNFLKTFPNVAHIEQFAVKPGIVKTQHESQAMVFKGVDESYDWSFFQQNLIDGEIPKIGTDSATVDVLVSKLFANKMNLQINTSFVACFVNGKNVSIRKFNVSGVYDTGFSDYDNIYILADVRHIRRINKWDSDMVSGLEVRVNDYQLLDLTAEALSCEFQTRRDREGNTFYVRSIKELNPSLFAWLDVLDMNIWIILILMTLVAGFSMISGLLIIILERTNMIGILKTLGENNGNIRKIFLYLAARIIGKGLLWGNIIAITVCLVQKSTGILRLNPDTYYLTAIPVEINVSHILIINFGVFAASLLFLLMPSMIIAGISPAKTIKFE